MENGQSYKIRFHYSFSTSMLDPSEQYFVNLTLKLNLILSGQHSQFTQHLTEPSKVFLIILNLENKHFEITD